MRLVSALALAGGALAFSALVSAVAETRTSGHERRIVIHGGAPAHVLDFRRIDGDSDGWVTRAEATAEAERLFGELDTNDDGKLDGNDDGGFSHHRFERRTGDAEGHGDPGERVERHVTVIRVGEGEDEDVDVLVPAPPHPRHPPRAPAVMMLVAHSDEFDRNNDGALQREEFVAQQVRFFDAGDGNGDGRVRFDLPHLDLPEPPEAPEPPAPPPRR